MNSDSGYFLPIMEATITALNIESEWIVERNDIYKERRDLTVIRLKEAGIIVSNPEASFYVWFLVPSKMSSIEYGKELLENIGVSLSPVTIFGSGGEGYMRISLTKPLDILALAIDRIVNFQI